MQAGEDRREQRWKTREMIEKLLKERQELMVQFCKVAGLEPYHRSESLDRSVQEFCQILVDYIAFAHFEVFAYINNGEERRSRLIKLQHEIYPDLVEASGLAVEFNDKYDFSDHALQFDHLAEDLSKLGEVLALRIEIEDQLIRAMLE